MEEAEDAHFSYYQCMAISFFLTVIIVYMYTIQIHDNNFTSGLQPEVHSS